MQENMTLLLVRSMVGIKQVVHGYISLAGCRPPSVLCGSEAAQIPQIQTRESGEATGVCQYVGTGHVYGHWYGRRAFLKVLQYLTACYAELPLGTI